MSIMIYDSNSQSFRNPKNVLRKEGGEWKGTQGFVYNTQKQTWEKAWDTEIENVVLKLKDITVRRQYENHNNDETLEEKIRRAKRYAEFSFFNGVFSARLTDSSTNIYFIFEAFIKKQGGKLYQEDEIKIDTTIKNTVIEYEYNAELRKTIPTQHTYTTEKVFLNEIEFRLYNTLYDSVVVRVDSAKILNQNKNYPVIFEEF